MNGVTEACVAGQMNCFPTEEDLVNCKIQSMKILYSRETKPGDSLDVFVWEDSDFQKRIHYQMMKNGKQMYYAWLHVNIQGHLGRMEIV